MIERMIDFFNIPEEDIIKAMENLSFYEETYSILQYEIEKNQMTNATMEKFFDACYNLLEDPVFKAFIFFALTTQLIDLEGFKKVLKSFSKKGGHYE